MDITNGLVQTIVELAVKYRESLKIIFELQESEEDLMKENTELSIENTALKKELEALKCQK